MQLAWACPFFVANEEGENRYLKIKSSEVCCLMGIALAKDNKTLYKDVFKEFYCWGECLKVEGLPASNGEPALNPFFLTHTCDLKASWYLSNRGGGCKTKDFFCTFCSFSRHHLTSYNMDDFRCDHCKQRGKSKCYHHWVHDYVSMGKFWRNERQNLVLMPKNTVKHLLKCRRLPNWRQTICKPIKKLIFIILIFCTIQQQRAG